MEPQVAIVGGGVSGLATAYYLRKAGISSTIIEASGRLGGLIQTDRVRDCDLEAGPDSFIATKPAVAELARELGIDNQLMGSNDGARHVFVVRDGKLVSMPRGMVMMVPSDWKAAFESPLFGSATKLGFVREYFHKPRTRSGDFSIRELILDHFGEEALHYLTEPLLSGVYGGDAASLSARSVLPRFVDYETNYGSLIKGVQSVRETRGPGSLFLSFQGGMQTLINELGRGAEVLHGEATAVLQNELGWEVRLTGRSMQVSQLVLACPAYRSAGLIAASQHRLAELLRSIPYSSCILVTFLFERAGFGHPLDGFGFLVPPPERQTIAAATWINTKFPSRIAEDSVGIRSFIVNPESDRLAGETDEYLTQAVLNDLQQFMQFTAAPTYSAVYRWQHSMPQYTVGHQERIDNIRHELKKCNGLHLASNFLDGVGIPDCVRTAKDVAAAVSKINIRS